jgi:hypothetical protein
MQKSACHTEHVQEGAIEANRLTQRGGAGRGGAGRGPQTTMRRTDFVAACEIAQPLHLHAHHTHARMHTHVCTFQVSGEINFFAGTYAGLTGLTHIRTCIHTRMHTHIRNYGLLALLQLDPSLRAHLCNPLPHIVRPSV